MAISAIHSAVSGIVSGIRSLNQRAARTANFHAQAQQTQQQAREGAGNPNATVGSQVDLVEDSVGRILDKRSIQANINVIKTQDEVLGSIIDITK